MVELRVTQSRAATFLKREPELKRDSELKRHPVPISDHATKMSKLRSVALTAPTTIDCWTCCRNCCLCCWHPAAADPAAAAAGGQGHACT